MCCIFLQQTPGFCRLGEGDLFSPHPHLENGPVLPPPGAPLCLYGKSCGSPPGRQRADAPPTPTGSPEPSAAMAVPDGPARRRGAALSAPTRRLSAQGHHIASSPASARQKPLPEGPQAPPPAPCRSRPAPAEAASQPKALRQTKAAARGPANPPSAPRRAASRPKAPARQKPPPESSQAPRQLSVGPLPGRKPSASQKPPPRARKPTASSLPGRTALAGLLPGRKPPPGEGRRPTALKPITRAALPLFTSSPSCSPARWPPCRSGVRSPSRSPPLPQIPFRSLQPVPPGVPAGTVRRGAPAPFASPPGR